MSHASSPSTKRRYGVVRVADEFDVPRSTYYDHKAAKAKPLSDPPKKRGPKTKLDDVQLTAAIREVLKGSPFSGEGHRKAWARLRQTKGIRTSQKRVLRLMRGANLLAPPAARRVLGPRTHDGKITTDLPDETWGTDATATFVLEEGYVTIFGLVDHCTSECLGIHVAKVGSRFAALEPIKAAVRERFGLFDRDVAKGVKLRHDHGSQYMSGAFQDEIRFAGIESSPAFVRAPEGNGVIERFWRTLKEQFLWVHSFRTVEDLSVALRAWVKTYNESWLVARHGYRSPAQVRRDLRAATVAA